jgi:hypothetical protein
MTCNFATNVTKKFDWAFHALGSHVGDENSRMCKLSSQLLGRGPACDTGDRGSIPGKDMYVSAQGALLEDGASSFSLVAFIRSG